MQTELSVPPSVSYSSVEVQKMSTSEDPKSLEAQDETTSVLDHDVVAMKLLWKEYSTEREPDYDSSGWRKLASKIEKEYPSTFQYYLEKCNIAWSKYLDCHMRKHSDPFRRFFCFLLLNGCLLFHKSSF